MKSVGKGTVEKRGKESWRLRISVIHDNGERERKSQIVCCRTKTEAKDKLDKWRTELLTSNTDVRREGLTLGEYLDEYLLYLRDVEELSPPTISGYRDIIKNRLGCHGLDSNKLTELKSFMLEEHFERLRREGGRTGRLLSCNSCHGAFSFLKTALKRAVILEYIPGNPCDRVKGPSMSRPDCAVLTEEEVRRMRSLLRGHPDPRFAMATSLKLATGLRRSEICELRWRDVDLLKGQIHVAGALVEARVCDSKDGKTLQDKKTKTYRSNRWLALDEDTLSWLKQYKVDQYYRLAYYGIAQEDMTPIMAGKLGEQYRPSCFTTDFGNFRRQHRFNIRLHDLRHTQASLLIKNGESPVTVSNRLGHARVSTTMDIYSHLMPGQDEDAAEKLGDIFKVPVA